ncbi:YebC-like protein [Pleomassaria siparia CBS 279.74]|uniref:YebC-like protein n=1 Tax=Pleomassaria siparia CBS 279.74 TaxID=1314801 RepID=A0A6G1KE35_9PLEO|nr:YebC-like protein [Pleomassaria siparia CBS 279.74]
MSTPFRRLVGPTRCLDSFVQCTCPRPAVRQHPKVCRQQYYQARGFSSSPQTWSGHSKWASIKHDKARADSAKSKQRSLTTKDITNAVKLGGPDPNMNPRLALAITIAKKTAVPKASIEAAIARGQGLSATGAALESVFVEAILPPSIAAVFECQTDNKAKLLAELRLLIKEAGGSVSPISYMFEKKGRVILEKKQAVGVDDVFEAALEAGALDVIEDDEGRVVVYTEPAQTIVTAATLEKELEVKVEESEIIWDPNEDTKVPLNDEGAAKELNHFLDALEDVSGIQGVYTNWSKGSISDDLWAELRSKVAA